MSQSLSETGEACSTGPLQRLGGERGVALQPRLVADKADADRKAALGQMARRDKAIAAIVAGPRHNHHALAVAQSGGRVGDGAAGILHQLDAGQRRRRWSGGRLPSFRHW